MSDHFTGEIINFELDQLAATDTAIGGFKA